MIEGFEHNGLWWLPNEPSNQVSGKLKFESNEGANLELIGSFIKDLTENSELLSPEIILGFSTNGRNITLHKCIETNRNLNIPGIITSSFISNLVLIGAHFEKPEDISFKSISVNLSYFDEWVDISGFDLQFNSDGSIIVEHKRPDSMAAGVSNDFRVSIKFAATRPLAARDRVKIEQNAYLHIESPQDKTLDEFISIINDIQRFLSLGILEPVYILTMSGKTEAAKISTREGPPHYTSVNVYYTQPGSPFIPKTMFKHNMLFTLNDIRTRLDAHLQSWLNKAELLKPVYDLYFGTLYNPRLYLEHKFLNYVHAIEIYHRRTMTNIDLPEEEHKRRVIEIINKVPDAYKGWLEDRLKYSNEPTLRNRFREIVDENSDVIGNFINSKVIQQIVTTRNYLTHYDESLKNRTSRERELYYLINKLRLTLTVCLLKEIDFSLEEINEIIPRTRIFRELTQTYEH